MLGLPHDFKKEYEDLKVEVALLEKESTEDWNRIINQDTKIKELERELEKYKADELGFIRVLDFKKEFSWYTPEMFKKVLKVLGYMQHKLLRDSYSLSWMKADQIHYFRRGCFSTIQALQTACMDWITACKIKERLNNRDWDVDDDD